MKRFEKGDDAPAATTTPTATPTATPPAATTPAPTVQPAPAPAPAYVPPPQPQPQPQYAPAQPVPPQAQAPPPGYYYPPPGTPPPAGGMHPVPGIPSGTPPGQPYNPAQYTGYPGQQLAPVAPEQQPLVAFFQTVFTAIGAMTSASLVTAVLYKTFTEWIDAPYLWKMMLYKVGITAEEPPPSTLGAAKPAAIEDGPTASAAEELLASRRAAGKDAKEDSKEGGDAAGEDSEDETPLIAQLKRLNVAMQRQSTDLRSAIETMRFHNPGNQRSGGGGGVPGMAPSLMGGEQTASDVSSLLATQTASDIKSELSSIKMLLTTQQTQLNQVQIQQARVGAVAPDSAAASASTGGGCRQLQPAPSTRVLR